MEGRIVKALRLLRQARDENPALQHNQRTDEQLTEVEKLLMEELIYRPTNNI